MFKIERELSMRVYDVDKSLIAWDQVKGDVVGVDIREIHDAWDASLSGWDRASRGGPNASFKRFLGARILARPDLLADNGKGVMMTAYVPFTLRRGSDIAQNDFEVDRAIVQSVMLCRQGTELRGAFLPSNESEQLVPFSLSALRSVMKPDCAWGQEGYGVGIREGYFMAGQVTFDDGAMAPNWVFGPVYSLPVFPDAPGPRSYLPQNPPN